MFVIEGLFYNKIYLYICTCKHLELASENIVIIIFIFILFNIINPTE